MELILTLMLLGVFASLEPVSVIAFVVVLATERGVKNGIAFIFGWVACVMVLLIAAAVFGVDESFEPGQTFNIVSAIVEMVLGVLLLLFAWYRRSHPPKPSTETESGLARRVANITIPGAFVFGALIQSWPVTIAAAAEITRAKLGVAAGIVAGLIYAVFSVATFIIMVTLSLRNPEGTEDRLDRLRVWIDTHRARIAVILSFVVGLYLLASGGIALAESY